GGTLPFSSETADEVLNKAYKNYSLLLHDRSFGIHNPGYIERLLDDSIAQVEHLDNLRLTAFTVQPGNQSVTVSWTTDYENGIDSFSLYRAESEHGQYRLLSGSETTAAGSAAVGTDYHYTDTGLANRTTYYYKLKDRDSEGKETMHGPLQAKPRLKYIFSKDE
ncbi:MAG: hypothetical protein GY868_04885, partial [Deltaproteobacteria bacterium]|nr:hypothetical protein [Deltaproteobacteria bacterium]